MIKSGVDGMEYTRGGKCMKGGSMEIMGNTKDRKKGERCRKWYEKGWCRWYREYRRQEKRQKTENYMKRGSVDGI